MFFLIIRVGGDNFISERSVDIRGNFEEIRNLHIFYYYLNNNYLNLDLKFISKKKVKKIKFIITKFFVTCSGTY